MKEPRTLYTDPYGSGMSIILLVFNEWHPESTPDGYSDEDGISVPVQKYIVRSKSGEWLKSVRYTGHESGREKTISREIRKHQAIEWLHSFSYYARYGRDKILHCDDLDGRSHHCPYLRISKENKAVCGISWSYWGYGTGERELPEGRKCDINIENVAQMLQQGINGRDWNMSYYDYWCCANGIAQKQIEKEPMKEQLETV